MPEKMLCWSLLVPEVTLPWQERAVRSTRAAAKSSRKPEKSGEQASDGCHSRRCP